MKSIARALWVFASFLFANAALARPTTFKNEGLKDEIVVILDVNKETATGSFSSHSYDEEPAPAEPFTGKVIRTPKGGSGVYLEIKFSGPLPYNAPPNAKTLVWHLTIVNHRAHLFIPMQQRSYEGKTPKWIVADVELEPVTGD